MDPAARRMLFFGIIGILIATSVVGVFRTLPIVAKNGTVSVYFASILSDIQVDPTVSEATVTGRPGAEIVSLNVTIDSVSVHRNGAGNGSGWTVISRTTVTLDVLKPTNVTVLISMGEVPEQNITMVRLRVASATASVKASDGTISSKAVVVSSGELKIPLGSVRVAGQLNTSIVASRPHIVVQGNGTIRLTPVLHADKVTGPD